MVWNRCDTLRCLGKSDFINAVETKRTVSQAFCYCFFATRFQLSLRVAALCSKALYRVKTTDSLDYKDLVCVFPNTMNPIAIVHSSFILTIKVKKEMVFKPLLHSKKSSDCRE